MPGYYAIRAAARELAAQSTNQDMKRVAELLVKLANESERNHKASDYDPGRFTLHNRCVSTPN